MSNRKALEEEEKVRFYGANVGAREETTVRLE